LGLVENFERIAQSLPYEADFRDVEIVEQRASRHGRAYELRLIVDRASGADLQLCERVAARVNASLERETDPYTLSVESPGLDRPLLRPADYERFRDRDVRVKTTLPIGPARTHRGTLLGVRGNAVILRTAAGELPIPLQMIESANLEYDYRADLRREKQERRAKR